MGHLAEARPAIDAQAVATVLSEIAEIASETLELQEVFDRVAASVRRLIPFDNMGVVRLVEGDRAVLHASTFPCEAKELECLEPVPLTFWSPRMRPRPGPNRRIDDALIECDPSFECDARCLASGVRSGMWEPFRSQQAPRGGVWLAAYEPHAFTQEHQDVLRPIAALLGSAVEHWRIWDAERRRRERLERIEALLETLAESLDVREVFGRMSEALQPILPHHLLAFTELNVPARSIRLVAWAGEADGEPPQGEVALTEDELTRRNQEFELLRDIPAELQPLTARDRIIVDTGMRSWLRVPVGFSGEIRGGLSIFHREPYRYDQEDAEIARRLADRVALMLSHQQLSEEARIAAEARERAERLTATVETLVHEMASRGRGRIVGVSRMWKDALVAAGRVAASDTTVLITGESGTGKELIANLIHQGSARAGKPFVAINCAALPEQLLESELFGHEKGAFTGAIATKIGKIEQAAGGTLFLDEIAEMSPQVQAKLLRVLQEREFQRVGGNRTLRAEIRVIAATNRDLHESIARQTFREDLYYRLNVFEIPIAPLRERPDDILVLAEAFMEDLGRTMRRPAAGISREAREWLLAYPWPGNVRELRNAIERALLLCDGSLIAREHLPSVVTRAERPAPNAGEAAPAGNGNGNGNGRHPAASLNLGDHEKSLVERALGESRGNKSRAARLLGLTRAQLYSRLEKYGMQ